ncbi:unnamed protein product [Pedinophyceae sp. YPF-701]|nr:unnamed protein product [Pedinophyceae sp. YPF-701]
MPCALLRGLARTAAHLTPRRSTLRAATSMSGGGDAAAPRGAFILFEGCDRSGKTTQTAKLVEALRARGVSCELWNFPDRSTPIGGMINAYLASQTDLDDHVVHLLFSANRWEKARELRALLAQGTTLVVDRYAVSGVAFSAAKGRADMDAAWCKAPDAGLPAPDVVLYLDVAPDVAAARGGYGSERYEREEFQQAVRQQYNSLQGPTWRVVDAAGTPEEVHARCLAEATAAVEACRAGGKPVGVLW